ncbi:hypothetical protein KC19_3G037900 [Ceratodon purpureus]|uniref:Uncharacterized protein n=1 Tax=Ceratodon purpureus TaxID=3225 RepID=A0A8T0II61_CERPU|nr:hypothetical protein KC19_3G037900 [Ceratodon purpureus]
MLARRLLGSPVVMRWACTTGRRVLCSWFLSPERRMEPRVRGMDYEWTDEEERVEDTREQEIAKRRMLVETFGSQKSKMRAQRMERGIVKEEALGDTGGMEFLFQEAGENEALLTNEQALQQANSSVVRNVPPHDISANTPEGAYPLDRLILAEEWENLDVRELKAAAKKAKDEEVLRQQKYPNFVLSRLRRIRVEGDKEGNDRRARILVYLRHLFTFFGTPHHAVRKAGADPGRFSQETGIPGIIVSSFLDRFTAESTTDPSNNSEARSQSKQHKDLLISYCLVLGMTVDDFQADPYDMALELKQTVNNLRPYYRELGCKFEARSINERRELGDPDTAQGKWRVTLPVPLKFPEIVTARGKGPRR